jgi:hypothetical protein
VLCSSFAKAVGTERTPDAAAVAEAQQAKPRARPFSETSSADAAAPQPARKKLKKKKGKAKPRSASSTKKPGKAERKAGARRKTVRASAAQTAQVSSAASQTVEFSFSGTTKEFKAKHVEGVEGFSSPKHVNSQIYEENGGLKVYGRVLNGSLVSCYFAISAKATGVMGKEYDRRKKACEKGKQPNRLISLHHAVALVTGCPVRNFSTERGGMTVDHKDENPGNNSLENLRVLRTELNTARQCDPDGVHGPSGNCYRFGKPFYNYIKPFSKPCKKPERCKELLHALWHKANDCTELKESGFFNINGSTDTQVKIRNRKTGVTDNEARKRAIARKRAQGRAVFAFLRREEPDLFKGWKPEQDAAGDWHWVEADFFEEFMAKWR